MKCRLLLLTLFVIAVSFSACKRYDPAGELQSKYALSAYAFLNTNSVTPSPSFVYFKGHGEPEAPLDPSSYNTIDSDSSFSRQHRVVYREHQTGIDSLNGVAPSGVEFKAGKIHSLIILGNTPEDVIFLEDEFVGNKTVGIRLIVKELDTRFNILARAIYTDTIKSSSTEIINAAELKDNRDAYLSRFREFDKKWDDNGPYIQGIELEVVDGGKPDIGNIIAIQLPMPSDSSDKDRSSLNFTIVLDTPGDNPSVQNLSSFSVFDHESF